MQNLEIGEVLRMRNAIRGTRIVRQDRRVAGTPKILGTGESWKPSVPEVKQERIVADHMICFQVNKANGR